MPAIQARLDAMALTLPDIAGPFGAYVPVKRVGNLLFVSGQLPMKDGKLMASGKVGSSVKIEQARAAVGVNALPLDASVEIEFVFEVE